MIRNTPTASCWCLRFYSLKDEYDESCHGGKGAGQGVCVASAARRGPECIARPGLYADSRRVPGFAWPFGRGQVDLAAHPSSEERRVGDECVRTGKSGGEPDN